MPFFLSSSHPRRAPDPRCHPVSGAALNHQILIEPDPKPNTPAIVSEQNVAPRKAGAVTQYPVIAEPLPKGLITLSQWASTVGRSPGTIRSRWSRRQGFPAPCGRLPGRGRHGGGLGELIYRAADLNEWLPPPVLLDDADTRPDQRHPWLVRRSRRARCPQDRHPVSGDTRLSGPRALVDGTGSPISPLGGAPAPAAAPAAQQPARLPDKHASKQEKPGAGRSVPAPYVHQRGGGSAD
jgi:hypothetical protein